MTAWREVQEALYRRWAERWVDDQLPPQPLTVYAFANEALDPPGEGAHVRLRVQRRPGGPGTLGSPGNRKMDRRGVVFALLREPPGDGGGSLSDLADKAGAVFENCRIDTRGIYFGACDIGEAAEIEDGRWWGVAVECPFGYEELK